MNHQRGTWGNQCRDLKRTFAETKKKEKGKTMKTFRVHESSCRERRKKPPPAVFWKNLEGTQRTGGYQHECDHGTPVLEGQIGLPKSRQAENWASRDAIRYLTMETGGETAAAAGVTDLPTTDWSDFAQGEQKIISKIGAGLRGPNGILWGELFMKEWGSESEGSQRKPNFGIGGARVFQST